MTGKIHDLIYQPFEFMGAPDEVMARMLSNKVTYNLKSQLSINIHDAVSFSTSATRLLAQFEINKYLALR